MFLQPLQKLPRQSIQACLQQLIDANQLHALWVVLSEELWRILESVEQSEVELDVPTWTLSDPGLYIIRNVVETNYTVKLR
jgi:hypothetical protein